MDRGRTHGPGGRELRRGLLVVGFLLVAGTSAGGQSASGSTSGQPGATLDRPVTGTNAGSPAIGSNAVDTSQGGVGGTGMGKMPPQTDQPGTGQSVKGRAGQGLTSTTDGLKPVP